MLVRIELLKVVGGVGRRWFFSPCPYVALKRLKKVPDQAKPNSLGLGNMKRHLLCSRLVRAKHSRYDHVSSASKHLSSMATTQSWSEEWKVKGIGARLPKPNSQMTNLLFVQMGFGVDQHGNGETGGSGQGATKAALRAVRNAIEFNSIPGIIEAVPGGREEMLISLKLGVPTKRGSKNDLMEDNLDEVATVFPYGRLLPIEVEIGGLSFHTGRIVRELGDVDDMAVCVAACVSIGYDDGKRAVNGV